MRNARLFSLSDPIEVEYPSVKLILPDGCVLIAKAIDDENFPAIDVSLLSDAGEEKLCFAEYNPERDKGKELCIGVYCMDSDDTTYYESYNDRKELK